MLPSYLYIWHVPLLPIDHVMLPCYQKCLLNINLLPEINTLLPITLLPITHGWRTLVNTSHTIDYPSLNIGRDHFENGFCDNVGKYHSSLVQFIVNKSSCLQMYDGQSWFSAFISILSSGLT